MALVLILGVLLTVLGTFKSCSSNNGPSYDYYDAKDSFTEVQYDNVLKTCKKRNFPNENGS